MQMQFIKKDTIEPQFMEYPKFLLQMNISSTANLVYMMLYDRSRLSRKNNWIDDEGNVYIVYPIANIARDIGKSQETVKKKIKELESAELLKKKRYGHNQPNRLYVLVPVDVDVGNKVPVREVKNDTCEGNNCTPVTGNKVPTNKIIESNNNNKNNSVSSYLVNDKKYNRSGQRFIKRTYEYKEGESL